MLLRKKEIANKIKKSRLEIRWSQAELARAVGLSDRAISAYETGRVNPPLNVIENISKQVGKPVSYFIDYDKDDYEVETKLLDIERRLKEVKSLIKKEKNKPYS